MSPHTFVVKTIAQVGYLKRILSTDEVVVVTGQEVLDWENLDFNDTLWLDIQADLKNGYFTIMNDVKEENRIASLFENDLASQKCNMSEKRASEILKGPFNSSIFNTLASVETDDMKKLYQDGNIDAILELLDPIICSCSDIFQPKAHSRQASARQQQPINPPGPRFEDVLASLEDGAEKKAKPYKGGPSKRDREELPVVGDSTIEYTSLDTTTGTRVQKTNATAHTLAKFLRLAPDSRAALVASSSRYLGRWIYGILCQYETSSLSIRGMFPQAMDLHSLEVEKTLAAQVEAYVRSPKFPQKEHIATFERLHLFDRDDPKSAEVKEHEKPTLELIAAMSATLEKLWTGLCPEMKDSPLSKDLFSFFLEKASTGFRTGGDPITTTFWAGVGAPEGKRVMPREQEDPTPGAGGQGALGQLNTNNPSLAHKQRQQQAAQKQRFPQQQQPQPQQHQQQFQQQQYQAYQGYYGYPPQQGHHYHQPVPQFQQYPPFQQHQYSGMGGPQYGGQYQGGQPGVVQQAGQEGTLEFCVRRIQDVAKSPHTLWCNYCKSQGKRSPTHEGGPSQCPDAPDKHQNWLESVRTRAHTILSKNNKHSPAMIAEALATCNF